MATKRTDRYKPVDLVRVFLWGHFVGPVALDPQYGFYAFAFDDKFRRTGIELAPLQMPVETADEPRLFLDLPKATYKRLPAFLADALPDDFGNALVDRYMAERGILPTTITVLDRLAYMGNRSIGALEFRPQRTSRSACWKGGGGSWRRRTTSPLPTTRTGSGPASTSCR